MIRERILLLNSGYQIVIYRSKKYGVIRTDFNTGRSIKVSAEELGGTDFISLNFYILKSGDQLKPCEMPEEKVLDFLTNYKSVLDS
jgi:peptide-methionine (S)-S-oxide reductase